MTEFFHELQQKFGKEYLEAVLSAGIIMACIDTWAPDINCIGLTPLIMELIFGAEHWSDAFGDEMPLKQGDGRAVYDASQFTDRARARA